MRARVDKIWRVVKDTFKQFPVEVCIMFYGFVMGALWIADVDIPHIKTLAFEPIFFVLAYALNNVFKRGSKYRLAYYLSWIPMMPLWLVDVSDWVDSLPFLILCVCAAITIFICRWAKDNRQFIIDGFRYGLNAVVALVFASVTQLLVWGIYYSIVYIFQLGDDFIPNFYEYSALFVYGVLCPTMFLAFTYNNIMTTREYEASKFVDILLNYIIAPALLIYTTVLYVYFLKIAFTWELPDGWLCYMVFCFVMVAMFAKALQPLLGERYYDWFFNHFSVISVPALIMFWVAALYRINEYGLTEVRFYLLLCGVIMTATLALFVCKNWGRYLWVFVASMLILALFTYIPPISAEKIGKSSQTARVNRLATELGMLTEQGEFITEGYPLFEADDSLSQAKCDQIYASLRYLFSTSDYKEKVFGLSEAYEFTSMYSGISSKKGCSSIYLHDNGGREIMDISDYRTFAQLGYYRHGQDYDRYSAEVEDGFLSICKEERVKSDKLLETGDEDAVFEETLVFKISLDSLLSEQLASLGYTREATPDSDMFAKHEQKLLIYEGEDILIMFSSMNINRSGSCSTIETIEVGSIFIK